MTANQIEYQKLQELKRANRANESLNRIKNQQTYGVSLLTAGETARANLAKERENTRHNKAVEQQSLVDLGIKSATLTETSRANQAREVENTRANMARERETHRANVANEAISRSKVASEVAVNEQKVQNMQTEDSLNQLRDTGIRVANAQTQQDFERGQIEVDMLKKEHQIQSAAQFGKIISAPIGGFLEGLGPSKTISSLIQMGM